MDKDEGRFLRTAQNATPLKNKKASTRKATKTQANTLEDINAKIDALLIAQGVDPQSVTKD